MKKIVKGLKMVLNLYFVLLALYWTFIGASTLAEKYGEGFDAIEANLKTVLDACNRWKRWMTK